MWISSPRKKPHIDRIDRFSISLNIDSGFLPIHPETKCKLMHFLAYKIILKTLYVDFRWIRHSDSLQIEIIAISIRRITPLTDSQIADSVHLLN